MSDDFFLDGQSRTDRLRYWGLGQMMKGALYAGTFCVAIGVVLLLIHGVGKLLPAESKQAPSPYGALENSQPLRVLIA